MNSKTIKCEKCGNLFELDELSKLENHILCKNCK